VSEKIKHNHEYIDLNEDALFADKITFKEILKDIGVPQYVVEEIDSIYFGDSFIDY